MTRAALAALLGGIVTVAAGLWLNWIALSLLGIGLLACVLLGVLSVIRPSRLSIEREIQPPRVPKNSAAIAFLKFSNASRRSVGPTVATQPYGGRDVRTVIPRLHGRERGVRTYRLPTGDRGIFDIGPVEVARTDPLDLFRTARQHGHTEQLWVYPQVLDFRQLPTGVTRTLEGPSSDTAPQGHITFHRLRDYVVGDDLRLVHWRSSARTGKLVVKHNVDTSQPYTVVVLDLRQDRYTHEAFEHAVDVAASVLVSASANKAPVELRLTDGTVIGGPRVRDVTPLIDHLTGVQAMQAVDGQASLQAELLRLRRARGGTALVVVTGVADAADLPYLAALRRRFERLVLIGIDPGDAGPMRFPGVRVISAVDADAAAAAWNVSTR
ncbi:MAG TPA: DUF58 domain-containing protein [Jatrophihabitans sp.]|nr:DUF58 domain-containing protein [Jatrophihabitans sp.]